MNLDIHPLLLLALHWFTVSLGVGGLLQAVKLPAQLYLFFAGKYPDEKSPWRRPWVWTMRTLAVYLGIAVGIFDSVWPPTVTTWLFRALLGISAGVFSAASYDVLYGVLFDLRPIVGDVLRARLGGALAVRKGGEGAAEGVRRVDDGTSGAFDAATTGDLGGPVETDGEEDDDGGEITTRSTP